MERIRVLIVDDETLVRHALRIFIDEQSDMEVIGEATDGFSGVSQADMLKPDVVLMDLRMPRMNGIEATKRVTQSLPGTAVLAVTTFSSEKHVIPALRAGAAGYLVKDSSPEQIVAAVRDVHTGRSVVPPHITDHLVAALRGEKQAVDAPPHQGMSDRELDIVRAIANGMSNAEIANQLHLSEPTIKAALSGIMRKWGVRDRVQVLIHAITHNIVEL